MFVVSGNSKVMNKLFRINALSTVLFFLIFLTFPSCRKCMTCTSKNAAGVTVYTYPENCGRKATLDAAELNYRTNLEDSLTLTCPRD